VEGKGSGVISINDLFKNGAVGNGGISSVIQIHDVTAFYS